MVEPEDACQTKNKNTPRGARMGLHLACWRKDARFMTPPQQHAHKPMLPTYCAISA